MAKCANDDCSTYMPESEAVWFKVQEEGRTGTSNVWGTVRPHPLLLLLLLLLLSLLGGSR